MTPPPALPNALLRLCLSLEVFECVAGDLEEAWNSGTLSRGRYWRLALVSIWTVLVSRLQADPGPPAHERLRKGDGVMRTFLQDLAYGARLMYRNPVFTAAAVATLALGIGANTAIFSMINVVSLEPLPYRDPGRVAFVRALNLDTQTPRFGLSTLEMIHLDREASTLEDVAAYRYWSANLAGGAVPERVQAYRVTANTFNLLGVEPLHGRAFTAAEGRPGGDDVVVLSFGLWQRLGGEHGLVGRDLRVDGRPHTVIGVMPRSFEFPVFNFKGELWAPMQLDESSILESRSLASAVVIARLREGVSYPAAQNEVDVVMRRLRQQYPDTNRNRGARLTEMGALDDENAGPGLLIVMGTVGAVLLLACANVANLLLARGVARQRELAVRAALGAGRGRLVRQLLAESLLLSLAGAVLGGSVAFVALGMLRARLPDFILTTMPNIDALGINVTTLTFTAVLALATSLVFGVIPAFKSATPSTQQEGLREGAAAGGSRGTRRLRSALVVGEVTMATALLIVAGLLVRSYQQQQRIDPGFDAGHVLTMAITLPEYKYDTPEARRLFFENALQRISAMGGVQAAGFVNVLPFSTYNRGGSFTIEGRPAEPGAEPTAALRVATPGYFAAMRLPLQVGRLFDSRDQTEGAAVALVNEALVRTYFGGLDPIGARIRVGRQDAAAATIVGIVGDVRHDQLTVAPQPEIYLPLAQTAPDMMMLAARTAGNPMGYAPAVRAAVQAVDPDQPVYHVKSLATMVAESMIPQASAAGMMVLFSLLALALAAVGIYGVIAYGVSQQRREFGVRLALGATRRDVLSLVLRGGLALVLTGVVLGAGLALASGRLLGGVLYGVDPVDPLTFVSVVALLTVVGGLACCIPAWRASRIEPAVALRID